MGYNAATIIVVTRRLTWLRDLLVGFSMAYHSTRPGLRKDFWRIVWLTNPSDAYPPCADRSSCFFFSFFCLCLS